MAVKKLIEPLTIGNVTLSSRIVMGPVGSQMINKSNVIQPSARDYYVSRSCVPGTLIIAEATLISAKASGWSEPRAGIWTTEQINAWKHVVDGIHQAEGKVFLQLWALGRQADPAIKLLQGTGDVVSSSSKPEIPGGHVPRAMTELEIEEYVADFALAAHNAVTKAGFDGVEIHGGNGSLVDQFIQSSANERSDSWGGSVVNRSRFATQITRAVISRVGKEKVGFRITPWSTYGGMGMSVKDTVSQFTHVVEALKDLDIAYLHLVESRIAGRTDVEAGQPLDAFIAQWPRGKPLLLAGGFAPDDAEEAITKNTDHGVAIVFGRAFVSNPDLVLKLREGRSLI